MRIPPEPFSSVLNAHDEPPLLLTTSRMVCDPHESLAFYQSLQQIYRALGAEFFEGVVMKRADVAYPVQLRSPLEECQPMMKHRFIT